MIVEIVKSTEIRRFLWSFFEIWCFTLFFEILRTPSQWVSFDDHKDVLKSDFGPQMKKLQDLTFFETICARVRIKRA